MELKVKEECLKRLNYIEGHLSGIRKMVEEDRYCVDVMKQTFAVRKSIEKLEAIILDGHLHTCVVNGIKEGNETNVLEELLELYNINLR